MVNTKQKPLIDIKRKEFKHTTTECHQTTREESKRRNKELQTNKKKSENKMATSTYLQITTLNVNRLNVPIKRHRVAEWLKKKNKKPRSIYMLLTKDSLQI